MSADDELPLRLGYVDGSEEAAPAKPGEPPPPEAPVELAPVEPPHAPPVREVVVPARPLPPQPPPMAPVLAFLLGIVVSVLPARWRERFGRGLPLMLGTLITAAFEVALVLLIARATIMSLTHATVMGSMGAIGEQGVDEGTMFGMGAAVYLAFLLSPLGILCVIMLCEGFARFAGAAATQEPVGTVFGWLAERATTASRAALTRWRLGPPAPDTVVTDDPTCAFRIESHRDKGWDYQTILHIDDGYYRVSSFERQERTWIYRLDVLPERETIKHPREYRRP